MRKRILLLLSIIFFILPKGVNAEEIQRFDAQISILQTGAFHVEERIDYDFGLASRHGIYRTIPLIKTNKEGKRYRMTLSVESVTDENKISYSYTTSTAENDLSIKIGDADKTITGLHTYIISYSVSGGMTYFSDHDELYWNITGNEWNVPIQTATATILLPSQIDQSQVKTSCFTGVSGSITANCTPIYENGSVKITGLTVFNPKEGMTAVVGFPKGIVAVLEPNEVTSFFSTFLGKIVLLLVGLLALFWYIIYPIWIPIKWILYGRDPRVGVPLRAWYDPPKTKNGRSLTPSESGVLIDEQVDARDIFGAIIDLARRGYLTIEERKKRDFYFIEKNTHGKEKVETKLQPFEEELLQALFHTGHELRLKDASLVTGMTLVRNSLNKAVTDEGFFSGNPEKTRLFYMAVGVFALMTGNIMLSIIAFVFGRIMPRKTRFGAEQALVAKSVRNFLVSQERQLAFQADNQMMFEKLLPFAIAFGVEQIWAKRFKDINLMQPSWYQGYDSGSFNTAVFMTSMHSSFSRFQGSMTPTRSSSGFSSGFSGGSSGGGGGGGGGGSW